MLVPLYSNNINNSKFIWHYCSSLSSVSLWPSLSYCTLNLICWKMREKFMQKKRSGWNTNHGHKNDRYITRIAFTIFELVLSFFYHWQCWCDAIAGVSAHLSHHHNWKHNYKCHRYIAICSRRSSSFHKQFSIQFLHWLVAIYALRIQTVCTVLLMLFVHRTMHKTKFHSTMFQFVFFFFSISH